MSIIRKMNNAFRLIGYELKGIYKSNKIVDEPVNAPVDFVVAWVDDSDENWQKERKKYFNSTIERNNIERYRDWNQFMFWFRSVEKYAPWVRKIHLVTFGHYPDWLNLENDKINIVKHEDFIPKPYLPTFQTSPIELNLHRISDLAEHFVYFNDDMYLNRPTKKEDFFSGIYPKCCNAPIPLKNYGKMGVHEYKKFNNVGMINGHFDIRKSIINNPELWFNKCYHNIRNYHIRAYRESYLYGMFFPHLGSPMRKSTMQEVWDVYEKELNNICSHKFRTPYDVFQQVFTIWEIAKGEFFPVGLNYFGKYYEITDDIDKIEKTVNEEKELMFCLNDTGRVNDSNYDDIKTRIDRVLLNKFPQKSSFEV